MAEADSPGGAGGFDFKPLEVDVNSVADLGKALVDEADHFGETAKSVKESLVDPGGKYESEHPVGVDPTQETLRHLANTHSERMADMAAHLDNVQVGLRNLGLVTQAITAQFGNQDGLNSVELGQMEGILRLDTGANQPGQEEA